MLKKITNVLYSCKLVLYPCSIQYHSVKSFNVCFLSKTFKCALVRNSLFKKKGFLFCFVLFVVLGFSVSTVCAVFTFCGPAFLSAVSRVPLLVWWEAPS